MSFFIQAGILLILIILYLDWVWTHSLTGKWMNKLWILIAPVMLYQGWRLMHTKDMHVAFLAIAIFVFGIAYLLTGLNKRFRRPFR